VCCGTEREVTIRCPLDCEYLVEARKHEHTKGLDASTIPHRDMVISDEFLHEHVGLIAEMSRALIHAASAVGAVDSDAREAIESLIQSYRTLQSGVIYEGLPANPLAADIYRGVQAGAAKYLELEREALGMPKTRDGDVLRTLVFFAALAVDRDNERRYGRSFLDALGKFQAVEDSAGGDESGSSLILP
jgi:hypothetical protein